MLLHSRQGFPPDIRVEKEARALCQAGFQVGLLCARGSPDQPDRARMPSGLEVFRCDPSPSLGERVARMARWLLTDWAVQPKWVGPVRTFLETFRPDVLHAHDIRITPTALHVANGEGLSVVADLHENFPSATRSHASGLPLWLRWRYRLTSGSRKWRRVERRALRRVDRVIAVAPEEASRLCQSYGLPIERVVVVSNTEDETTFPVEPPDSDVVARYSGAWTAAYVGGVNPHRGLDVAIRAAPLAAREIPNFKLLIVGARGPQRAALLDEARRAGAEPCVELVEWVPREKVPSYIAASRACLIPHRGGIEQTENALPHKLFQYMLSSRPVIASSCRVVARIVRDADAGLVFQANDPQDLARCLVELHRGGTALERRLGGNGRRAALGPYAWRHDAARLVRLYQELGEELGLT
jgi:glycosyltransferase involved in cell wall biosynthesis